MSDKKQETLSPVCPLAYGNKVCVRAYGASAFRTCKKSVRIIYTNIYTYLLLNFEFFLTFLSFLSFLSLLHSWPPLLLLVAIEPSAFEDDYFGAIAAAFVQVAESVGQIVLPFAIVFGPVEHALDVLRVVGAEDCHRATPNACSCAFAKPVEVSLVEASVAHFCAFCV